MSSQRTLEQGTTIMTKVLAIRTVLSRERG